MIQITILKGVCGHRRDNYAIMSGFLKPPNKPNWIFEADTNISFWRLKISDHSFSQLSFSQHQHFCVLKELWPGSVQGRKYDNWKSSKPNAKSQTRAVCLFKAASVLQLKPVFGTSQRRHAEQWVSPDWGSTGAMLSGVHHPADVTLHGWVGAVSGLPLPGRLKRENKYV